MRSFLKERHAINLYSNIVITLLCTSSLFSGYYRVNVDNEVKHTNARQIMETDLEPLSQEANAGTVKRSVKIVTSRQEVSTSNGYYVPASYSSVTGDAVVNYAMRYLGLPYKNYKQGTSLQTGTDCSGFTMLIYREFGVSLSRTVYGQMGNGSYIRKSDLQKGDLVFYGYGNRATHVTMYIGNGKVIHESTYGQGVKITGINQMGMNYITARRVINAKAIAKVTEQIKKEEETKVEATQVTTPEVTNVVEEVKQEPTTNVIVEEQQVADQQVVDTSNNEVVNSEVVETPKVTEPETVVKEEVVETPTPVSNEVTENSVNTENE